MCRLLGVVTDRPQTLSQSLEAEIPLFTALSERHCDGWGVAWSQHGEPPRVRRSTETALRSSEYSRAVHDARGDAFLVHLRRASPGLPLELRNTHPFTAHGISFVHNGEFDLAPGLRERVLTRGGPEPEGTTDSELLFSLVLALASEQGVDAVADGADWARILQEAAAELTWLLAQQGGRPPEALNLLLLTPTALVASTRWDPPLAARHGIGEDIYALRIQQQLGRVVLSSSGYDLPGARTLPQGAAAWVDRRSLAVGELPPRYAPLGAAG